MLRLVTLLALLALPNAAWAFCGFYVASADGELVNEATHVALYRSGTTTVLSMQNDYRGPTRDFAMVVPVPTVLSEEDVHTLPKEVFGRLLALTGPRLVEYWEQDPCAPGYGTIGLGNLGMIGHGGGGGGMGYGRGAGAVTVEAEFAVGEYDIVILSARESGALDEWLRANDYRIPEGAAEVLRPYVESGMKFFVAKVNARRVRFYEGVAQLSPLRIQYESEQFALPVRLGMLNSAGSQDLIVHILGARQRYEVANYPNAFIPTNLDLAEDARDRFGAIYDALFLRTLSEHPGAVITEYAWSANGCDPCPVAALTTSEVLTLGGDVTSASARVAAHPRMTATTLDGPLDSRVAQRVMRRHSNEVRYCAERNGALEGEARLSFTVSPEGRPERLISAGDNDPFAQCLGDAVQRWTFPSGDTPSRMRVRLELHSQLQASGTNDRDLVLTRLHYRYGAGDLGEDLVFRVAEPMSGGREAMEPSGELGQGATPAPMDTFQARYAIRHAWTGAIECDEPIRGRWGGPPSGAAPQPISLTRSKSSGAEDLDAALSVPALGTSGQMQRESAEALLAAAEVQRAEATEEVAVETPVPATATDDGCGCHAAGGGAAYFGIVALLAWLRRR